MAGRERVKQLAIEEAVSWAAGIMIVLIILLTPAPHNDGGTHYAPSEQEDGER